MNAAPSRREKTGIIEREDVLHPLELLKLRPLCERLNAGRSLPLHSKEVALMIREVQNFMDLRFGLKSAKPREFVKLPYAIFRDFSIDGSAELIVREVLACVRENGWPTLDLTSEDVRADRFPVGLQLLRTIEEQLLRRGALQRPRVFFHASVPAADIQRYAEIVRAHGGSVVPTVAAASHSLELDPEIELLPPVVDDYIQPLDVRLEPGGGASDSGKAWVHWWYHPPCYDEWVSALEVSAREPPQSNATLPPGGLGHWRVNLRFLRDLELFNEWGNEADYLIEERAAEDPTATAKNQTVASPIVQETVPVQAKRKSKKRKSDAATEAALAAQADAEEAAQAVPVISRGGVKPGDPYPVVGAVPGATDKVYCDYAVDPWVKSAMALTPHRGASSLTVALVLPVTESGEEVVQLLRPPASAANAFDAYAWVPDEGSDRAVLTGPPSWYSPASVREPELRFLASLLGPHPGVRQVARYVRSREHLVATYVLCPAAYLSATDARHRLAMDAAFVCRVHEFLDAYRVINWGVLPENLPYPALLLHSKKLPLSQGPSSKDRTVETVAGAWDPAWDASLLRQLRTTFPSGGAVPASVDWDRVARDMAVQTSSGGPTAAMCMIRFAGMNSRQLAASTGGSVGNANSCPARLAALRSRLSAGRLAALATHIAEHASSLPAAKAALAAAGALQPEPSPLPLVLPQAPLVSIDAIAARLFAAQEVEAALSKERSRISADRKDALALRARVAAFAEYRSS
jgi:hypothetical protein